MLIFLEFLGAALVANFLQSVFIKILVDRAALAVESIVVIPAIEYVKTRSFWDKFDEAVDKFGGHKIYAFISLVKKPTVEALDYVLNVYSEENHQLKKQCKDKGTLADLITLED